MQVTSPMASSVAMNVLILVSALIFDSLSVVFIRWCATCSINRSRALGNLSENFAAVSRLRFTIIHPSPSRQSRIWHFYDFSHPPLLLDLIKFRASLRRKICFLSSRVFMEIEKLEIKIARCSRLDSIRYQRAKFYERRNAPLFRISNIRAQNKFSSFFAFPFRRVSFLAANRKKIRCENIFFFIVVVDATLAKSAARFLRP